MWLLALAPLLLAAQDVRATELVTLDSYHPFTPPASAEEWATRREALRRRVLVAAGLWPEPPRVPLEGLVHGAIERDGYVVSNVAFQALPGFWVTGNLYRPTTGDGPFPAVLCPHGHWDRGRFTVVPEDEARAQIERGEERHLANAQHHLQARCAELARRGCLVLHYDMIGYADSRQLDHREGLGDVEAELWGMSHFGLQTLSSIRALDWVLSREDVDPARVAVTGGSGGGTQTFVLGAVDDRPAALFPAVMVSTGMQGGCVCENASHLRVGTGNVELAGLAAPRPLGLTGADDWTKEIEAKGLPELQRLYALLGAPADVEAWCYPTFPHNYNLVSRTRMYEWLNRHLELGHATPIEEAELVPVPPAELSVWTDEHPRPSDARDLAGVRSEWLALQRASVARIHALVDEDPAEFRRFVGGALETIVAAELPGEVEVVESDGDRLVLSPAGAGHRVALRSAEQANDDALDVTVLWVGDDLEVEFDLDVRRAAVVVPMLTPPPVDSGRHGRYVGYTWGYNRTLVGRQVQDVLTAIAYLRATDDRPVRLVGLGEMSTVTTLAAALAGDAVERVMVGGGQYPFAPAATLDDPGLLPRFECSGGIGAFAALIAPRPLYWIEFGPPEVLERAYAAAGAPDSLRRLEYPPEGLDWLLE